MTPEDFKAIFDSCVRIVEALRNDELMRLSDAKREFKDFVDWDKVQLYTKKTSTTRWVRRGDLVAMREQRNLKKIACKL